MSISTQLLRTMIHQLEQQSAELSAVLVRLEVACAEFERDNNGGGLVRRFLHQHLAEVSRGPGW